MFEVMIETANRDPRHVRCLSTVCGIGRGEENLVVLQGWNIAREHASLNVRGGGVFSRFSASERRSPSTVHAYRVSTARWTAKTY